MHDAITEQRALFGEWTNKPIEVRFDQPDSSSDGGALLLKAADERLGLSRALSGGLRDDRDPARVVHGLHDLLRQRLFAIATGAEDCNDAARLIDDPVHRLLLDRDPISGARIASQPTLSRFEHQADGRSLVAMGQALADTVIARHRQRLGAAVRRITIDLDPTDDPTHGQQQLSLFNGHYRRWCYVPIAGFISFGNEAEQYLFTWVLRPGDAHANDGSIAILERLFQRLRAAFPGVMLRVRLDGGFASTELFEFLDDERVEYVVAIANNARLGEFAVEALERVRQRSFESGESEREYLEDHYQGHTWSRERRVVIKAEVVRCAGRSARDNARFVVTNLRRTPRFVYERVYCQRGDIENRLKELLNGLQIGRTSCTSFLANQLRGLLTAAAYVLYQEIRLAAKESALAGAQVSTLRERLIKLGAWLTRSTRRIVLHLPTSSPWRHDWIVIARALGATPG